MNHRKMEEVSRQQQYLQDIISEKESSIHNLEEQLEAYHSENEQLQAKLASLKEKCRELERSAAETQEKPVSATTTTLPSDGLSMMAPAFRSTVRFLLPGETSLGQTEPAITPSTAFPHFSFAGLGATQPAVIDPSMSSVTTSASLFSSSPLVAHTIASERPTLPSSVPKEAVPTTTPFCFAPTSSHAPVQLSTGLGSPTGIVGTTPAYPMVHPTHLPTIPNFHGGEQCDGETFEEWLDHFEAVANIARWDTSFKIVHQTAALRGNAKSFYRSCTPTQKRDYTQLVSALKKRFTPVKLTALQTQMFHSRKQGATESVDDYAQELRKLHSKAYSTAVNGNTEAEKVGQIVLLNQFVSGLQTDSQAKVVGVEGSMDEIVAKARFEEAKLREVPRQSAGMQPKFHQPRSRSNGPVSHDTPTVATPAKVSTPNPPPERADQPKNQRSKTVTCFQCCMEGHFWSNCPYPKQAKEGSESRGKTQVKTITPQEQSDALSSKRKKEIQILREKLRQAELEEAIESSGAVSLVVPAEERSRLGPTVYAPVAVEGVSAVALIDTGSPATIASLEFVLKVFQHNRPKDQTNAQWTEVARGKLKNTDVLLKNYGGYQLDFIAQTELTLSRGNQKLVSTVLVRKDAPNDLLVGTDVQPQLGFSLIVKMRMEVQQIFSLASDFYPRHWTHPNRAAGRRTRSLE